MKRKKEEVLCFDIRKIKFNRKKNKKENDLKYIEEVSKFFKKYFTLPEFYNYSAYKLKANKKTLDILEKKLSGGVYLFLAPVEDNTIEDYKICGIFKDKKELIEKRRKK